MADTIKLEVSRYSPETDAAPHFQSFEVPFRRDWVVLDALNYIKDKQDGSLTYRWSCRMGICGSCGMLVNGEPNLTCATFLADYAASPVRIEPLRTFTVVRDLVIARNHFMRKLQENSTPTNSSACALTACSATLRAPFTASTRSSPAPQPSRSPSATISIPAIKAPKTASPFSLSTTPSGAAPLSANARGSAPSTSIPPVPSSNTNSPPL